ncbi:hypothetical protein AQUCO_00400225v1 [Aquilegia coerulea]|uniref:Pentacotripeptide-repeat region of PRORP domain-containing protein n=1 Tax=Aquilegia coerulea TaxID=218851 RepID=A0A2G5EU73_AQUCA|nr:hypothetical protein AQUCO_00400225v1 [Aquilegia coerulea]
MEHYHLVFDRFKLMLLARIQPSIVTLSILINCCCYVGPVNLGFAILASIFKHGYEPNHITFNTLLKGLSRKGDVKQVINMFNKLLDNHYPLDVVTIGVVTDALCKANDTDTALKLMTWMEKSNIKPDVKLYSTIIDEMVTQGVQPNVVTYTCLIYGLCRFGRQKEAMSLFKKMLSQNIKPNIVEMMSQTGQKPDVFTYKSLIYGLCVLGQWNEVTKLFSEMESHRISPNVKTYNVLIDHKCKKGKIDEAHHIFETMKEKGEEPDIITYNSLMNGYCLQERMEEAKRVWDLMIVRGHEPNVYTYNTLINGYCKARKMDDGVRLLNEMQAKGLKPNITTYDTLTGNRICRINRPHSVVLMGTLHTSVSLPLESSFTIILNVASKGAVICQVIDKAI